LDESLAPLHIRYRSTERKRSPRQLLKNWRLVSSNPNKDGTVTKLVAVDVRTFDRSVREIIRRINLHIGKPG
jgi:hypothetical protein